MGYSATPPRTVTAPRVLRGELFRWNEADASQFDASASLILSGPYAPTLTVTANTDTDCPSDNFMRFDSGNTAGGTVMWLAKDPLPLVGENRSYQIEYLVKNNTQASGIVIMADKSGGISGAFYGIDSIFGGLVLQGVAGATGSTGDFMMGDNEATWRHVKFPVRGRKKAGTNPEFIVFPSVQGGAYDVTGDGYYKANDLRASSYGAFPAGWNGLDCLHWGFYMGGNPGAQPKMDIGKIRITTL